MRSIFWPPDEQISSQCYFVQIPFFNNFRIQLLQRKKPLECLFFELDKTRILVIFLASQLFTFRHS
ncbi:MAG: hypothetical protein CMN89_01445 [Sutterellaceae bacterium]|nr:hypothetical protein [Alcaligenaceae bacterium]MBT83130.1 hypothetical protein [Sutterellaceae bacterium]PZO14403.1 MAG: hypothetical protein DCE87_10805 [Betaproteobacteria bacterium]HAV74824.1 hypothetical protein [Limnobacter sp.]PZO24350.1 MAG: hypothetical protein DCE89_06765 [Betaproteobacteria bacterium]